MLKLGCALLDKRIAALGELMGRRRCCPRLHGPSGATAEDGAPLLTAANTIAGGTTEIMKNILGERILGLPPEPHADKDVAWAAIPKGA